MTDYPARVERFIERFLKKLAGKADIDEALWKLDKLMQEGHQMAVTQALRATHYVTHSVREKIDVVIDGV
jgi:hypothetical protein